MLPNAFFQLDVARYTSADIRLSDHRPVMAIIRCRYKIVDKVKRDKFASEILDRLHKEMSPGLIVQSRTSSPISINLENGQSDFYCVANRSS